MTLRTDQHPTAENPHVVSRIVEAGLCVRCGACGPACPVEILRFDEDHWPIMIDEPRCIRTCTRCLDVCPGGEVDFEALDDRVLGRRPNPESVTGAARRAVVGFAADESVRRGGTSGGFVTQMLIYLIEKKIIDGALVLGSTSGPAGWRATPILARTLQEVKSAAKSKYTLVPHLAPLGEIERTEGRYAVVALPCHVHALRKYQQVSRSVQRRIHLVIGLFCNVALEPRAVVEICEEGGIAPADVEHLDFRRGPWPGGLHATLRDGRVVRLLKRLEMRDQFNLLRLFHTPRRCNMCIDFSAEHADLAVGDPWLRGPDGEFLFRDGRSCVLVRTEAGERALEGAVSAGYLNAEEIPLRTFMVSFERLAAHKKTTIPRYIRIRKRLGHAVPNYHRSLGGGRAPGAAWPALKLAFRDLLSRSRLVRRVGIRMAQTTPALIYLRWNDAHKASRFAAAYRDSERRIERFLARGEGTSPPAREPSP